MSRLREDYSKAMTAMNHRPLCVYPAYIRLTGSLEGGVLLSQLCFWSATVNGREFYKIDAELRDETCLTDRELRKAKASARKCKALTVTVKGVPAKTFYHIDMEKLFDELKDVTVQASSYGVVQTGSYDGVPAKTESTAEITQEEPTVEPLAPARKSKSMMAQFSIRGEVFGEWKKATGGILSLGSEGCAAFAALEAEHGGATVLAAWKRFCASGDRKFKWRTFVSFFGKWAGTHDAPKAKALDGQFEYKGQEAKTL